MDVAIQHGCAPNAPIPSWWSGFLFHVLNPRQVCMYVYLVALSYDSGECHPTIDEIREDLGLYSASMVFEALSVLEELGFIVRERQTFPGVRARRNVYRRMPCEYTLLRLLERERIDGHLHARGSNGSPAAHEARELVIEGLRGLLGSSFVRYERATSAAKQDVLVELLRSMLPSHGKGEVQ